METPVARPGFNTVGSLGGPDETVGRGVMKRETVPCRK